MPTTTPITDYRDAKALAACVAAHAAADDGKPRVGDVAIREDGTRARIASVWDGFPRGEIVHIQLTPGETRYGRDDGSFFLEGSGAVEHSGGLDSPIPFEKVTPTDRTEWAPMWIWHHGQWGGGRGRVGSVPVRVWEVST